MEVLTLLLLTLPSAWSMPAEWSAWAPVEPQDGNDASPGDSGDFVDDLIDGVPDGGLQAPGDSQDSPGPIPGLSVPGLGPIGGLGLLGGGAALATIAGIAASTGFAGAGIAKAIHKQTNKLSTKLGFTKKSKTFDVLHPGDGLDKLAQLVSKNGKFKLLLEEDGNLVISEGGKDKHNFGVFHKGKGKAKHKVLWSMKTAGAGGTSFKFQEDGDLVVLNGEANAIWNSGTAGLGGEILKMTNDGFLTLLGSKGEQIWQSSPHTLLTGQNLPSVDGKQEVWNSGTGGLTGDILQETNDGKQQVWNSGTGGLSEQILDGKQQEMSSILNSGTGGLSEQILDDKQQEMSSVWSSGSGGLSEQVLQIINDGKQQVKSSILENLEIPEMTNDGKQELWNSGTGGLSAQVLQIINDGKQQVKSSVLENLEIPEMINPVDIQSLLEGSPLTTIQDMNYDEMTSQAENFEELMSNLREGKLHIASGWTIWSEFTACSATCGPAIKMRERVCIEPANGGTMCQGPTAEIFNCDLPICGAWSGWSDVTECSATCGPAVKTRRRTCTDNSNGGLNCLGYSEETVDCDLFDCPEDTGNDGAWSAWSDFSACSASCGSATKWRARTCSHIDPTNEEQICQGPTEEIADCDLPDCQVTGGEWSGWSDFSSCSATCGPATKRRERTCTGPETSEEGLVCQGPKENVVDCNLNDCPVDGGWSAWTDFSACNATCGPATKRRRRTCTQPEPSNGGILCQGLNEETVNCDLAKCDTIDGGWSAWSDFSACSATCGPTTKSRTRSCTEPEPSDGGILCQGLNEETLSCELDNCAIDGGWSAWTDFSACSATCGMATKKRTRTCTEPEPSDGGQVCQGLREEVTHCNFVFC